jgi:hypothetical protein
MKLATQPLLWQIHKFGECGKPANYSRQPGFAVRRTRWRVSRGVVRVYATW